MRRIPVDSVDVIYNSFSPENKSSTYAKEINELLNKKIIKFNDNAPYFNVRGISSDMLSLESCKENYLLIDFWAIGVNHVLKKFQK